MTSQPSNHATRTLCLCVLVWSCVGDQMFSQDLLFNANILGGKRFDGIGAISGGGATSKLLHLYKKDKLEEIFDVLFKPDHLASLHALKVEIGGDAQSTEGCEASHMHTEEDENYFRGYEWLVIKEALKRNPKLILHALPWAFPGWVENDQTMASYVTKWLTGARRFHNANVSTIGCWNERPIALSYIRQLRRTLDASGLAEVKIVATDSKWELLPALVNSSELRGLVHALGVHYPSTRSPPQAKHILPTLLWATEDYSTPNDIRGAACWARTLSQNYAVGGFTSTIAWNAVTSFFADFPYNRCSLMNAQEPWTGNYEIPGTIYVTAHHTHFYQPGWRYLSHEAGVGLLSGGGSYISVISPDENDFTIVLETISFNESRCFYDQGRGMEPADQHLTLHFQGPALKRFKKLFGWRTVFQFGRPEGQTDYLAYLGEFEIADDGFQLNLPRNAVVTLSSMEKKVGPFRTKFSENPIVFPLPYTTDFTDGGDQYAVSEPNYLTPQFGYFEIVPDPFWSGRRVLQQMVQRAPKAWCQGDQPLAIMGDAETWRDMTVTSSVHMMQAGQAEAIFVAARISDAGCAAKNAKGVFFWLNFREHQVKVSTGLDPSSTVIATTFYPLDGDHWYDVSLALKGRSGAFTINDRLVMRLENITFLEPGFVGLGSLKFGYSAYRYFSVSRTN